MPLLLPPVEELLLVLPLLSPVTLEPHTRYPPNTGLENPPRGTNNLIRQILSTNRSTAASTPAPNAGGQPPLEDFIKVEGVYYRRINTHSVQYNLSRHSSGASPLSSLIDGGANGGMTGSDARILSTSDFHKANVTGIGDSIIQDIPLVTAASVVKTH